MSYRIALVTILITSTFTLCPAQDAPPSVDDLAWLAGSWRGTAFGGTFEETWDPPSGGSMMGMFKLIRDGRPEMYELMRIAPVDGDIVLDVKHFSAEFVAWEEKTETTRFVLKRVRDGLAEFDGIVFRRRKDGRLDVELSMRDSATGRTRTEHLVYHPADASSDDHRIQDSQ